MPPRNDPYPDESLWKMFPGPALVETPDGPIDRWVDKKLKAKAEREERAKREKERQEKDRIMLEKMMEEDRERDRKREELLEKERIKREKALEEKAIAERAIAERGETVEEKNARERAMRRNNPFERSYIFGSLGSMVTLIAGKGDQQKPFTIHKKLLCDASPVFKGAFKRDPKSSSPPGNVLYLPDDEPEIIRAMIYWIYEDRIWLPKSKDDEHGEIIYGDETVLLKLVEVAMKTPWAIYLKIYMLADRYQMPLLCNFAIDALIVRFLVWEIHFSLSQFVYENTTPESPLRRIWIAMAATCILGIEFRVFRDKIYPPFLFDLTLELYKGKDYVDEYGRKYLTTVKSRFCERFHVHETEEFACRTAHTIGYYDDEDENEDED